MNAKEKLQGAIALTLGDLCFEEPSQDLWDRVALEVGKCLEQHLKDPESWRVVCDETNNTPWVVDHNGLQVDAYIHPSDYFEEEQKEENLGSFLHWSFTVGDVPAPPGDEDWLEEEFGIEFTPDD